MHESRLFRYIAPMKLSIVIPVYNEVGTIDDIIRQVLAVDIGMDRELVLVDDCSSDGSRDKLKSLQAEHADWNICFHDLNQGKGAALRTGFAAATLEPRTIAPMMRKATLVPAMSLAWTPTAICA